MNSIAAYCIADALGVYISKSLKIHLGENYATIFRASLPIARAWWTDATYLLAVTKLDV